MRTWQSLIVIGVVAFGAWGEDNRATQIARAKAELEPRLLTFQGQASVADFLVQLEKQTGNVVADRRSMRTDMAIALAFDRVSFWQALDRFCLLAGCGYTTYGSDGGVALIDMPRKSSQVSYHGITRTVLKRVVVAREFDNGAGACTLHLDLAWEPRFQPFYVGIGPGRAQFAKDETGKEQMAQTPHRGQIPVAGRSAVEVEVTLPAPRRSAPAIAALEGSFRFLGPSKMLTFRFPEIKTGAAQEQEEVSLRLAKVKDAGDRWLVEVQIDNPAGTPVFESYQTWLDNNRIALVKGEAGKQQTWLPEPNETVLLETNCRAVIQYAFALPKAKRTMADWALVYRTPGRIVELTVPYSFKNIALP